MNLTEEEADKLGRIVDTLDNLIAAMTLRVPDSLHVEALRASLPRVRRDLAEAIGYDEEEGK